jgi:hypothetical protein
MCDLKQSCRSGPGFGVADWRSLVVVGFIDLGLSFGSTRRLACQPLLPTVLQPKLVYLGWREPIIPEKKKIGQLQTIGKNGELHRLEVEAHILCWSTKSRSLWNQFYDSSV